MMLKTYGSGIGKENFGGGLNQQVINIGGASERGEKQNNGKLEEDRLKDIALLHKTLKKQQEKLNCLEKEYFNVLKKNTTLEEELFRVNNKEQMSQQEKIEDFGTPYILKKQAFVNLPLIVEIKRFGGNKSVGPTSWS